MMNITNRSLKKRFVQTELRAHELWANLIIQNKRAAQLMHILVANVGSNNAVVLSQKNLAKMMSVKSVNTVKTALACLSDNHWIDIIQVGERGGVNAYAINSNVAWGEKRDGLQYAMFTANIVASSDEQKRPINNTKPPLHTLPMSGERQLPSGPGLPPVSSPSLPSMEPALPSARCTETLDLEDYCPETGEIK